MFGPAGGGPAGGERVPAARHRVLFRRMPKRGECMAGARSGAFDQHMAPTCVFTPQASQPLLLPIELIALIETNLIYHTNLFNLINLSLVYIFCSTI